MLSVWVQNPNAEAIGANAFSSTSFFVGTVDFNMGTGELIAATPAEGETIAVGRTSSPGNNSGTFATSGTRQIGFGYNGDTKVFTGLQFSGAFTGVQTYVGPIGFGIAGDYVYQWTGTDSRQVHLVHGSFSQLVAFADVATDTEERSGHKFSSGDFTVTSSDVQYAAAIQTATLLYHNGAPVFEVASSHYDAAETIGSSSAEIASTVKVYVAGDVLDLGVSTGTLAGATRAGTQLTTGIVGDFRVPSFIDTGTTTRWGCAGQQNMALLSPSGFLSFAAPGAADESPFNGRAVDDFAIVSVPMLKPTPGIGAGTYVLDPARFYTYCTDTAIIEKINAGDVNSVLKGISLR